MKKISVGALAALLTCSAYANPVVDHVAAGNVSIQQAPDTTTINQASQKAIINWQSFNIHHGETTHFNQPVGGVALNRISPTQGASQIYGTLTATGQIILVNPAGIYFGPSAYVNVGGLVASTANITDQQFMNNMYQFSKVNGYAGAIVNEGQIMAAQHGLVALVAPGVVNNGTIQANLGKVILASGEAFTLNFSGDNLINFAIDAKTTARGVDANGNVLADGVKNTGSIFVNGGTVQLSAYAAAGVLDHAINMEGVVHAKLAYVNKGEIILSASPDAGVVRVAGKLDASGKSAGQKGGTVTVTGHNILLDNNANIDVAGDLGGGNVYIGGNYQGNGPLPNANAVVMAPDAIINANAITHGNGGEVILWADNVTKAYGSISAQGGALSGDGGFVETSAHYLDVNGIRVNTLAANGESGMWLLDPYNITINNDPSDNINTGSNPWTPSGTLSTINAGALGTALNSSNITITTAGAGVEDGNITFADANGDMNTNWTTNNRTLTLQADNDIYINAPIILRGTTQALVLIAGNTTATGSIITNAVIRGEVADRGAVTMTAGSNGSITINESLGNAVETRLRSLTVNSPILLNANIFTNYDQIYNAAVTPGLAVTTLTSSATSHVIRFTEPLSWLSSNTLSLAVNSSGGWIELPSSISAPNGGLVLSSKNAAGSIITYNSSPAALTTAIDVNSFNLARGWWVQLDSVLPAFHATDFRTNNGNGPITTLRFIRALGGDGSSDYPYQISDVYGLQGVGSGSSAGSTLSSYYQLANNIDAVETVNWNAGLGFLPIGRSGNHFVGYVDGLSYIIDGLTINRPSVEYIGLFGLLNAVGIVLNVGITNANISGHNYTGGLAGWSAGLISNSYVDGNISGWNSVGGLVGQSNNTTINNSYSMGHVTGNDQVGGLIGYNSNVSVITNSYSTSDILGHNLVGGFAGYNNASSVIESSYSTGNANGHDYVGGFVGQNYNLSSITNSYSTGDANSDGAYVGGFAGMSYNAAIDNSYSTGNAIGNDSVGGFVGYNRNSAIITNSHSTGNASGNNNYVGGFAGQNYNLSSIANSYSTGNASGNSYVGGFAGLNYTSATIENSYSMGNVISSGLYVGGFTGQNHSSTINNSYSTGNASGSSYVGGFVGQNRNSAIITNSYSTGDANGGDYTGGFAGLNYISAMIESSYSMGNAISSGLYVGGFVGQNYSSSINNSYSTGNASGNSYVGGFAGQHRNDAVITNSYSMGSASGNNKGGFIGYTLNNATTSNSYWNTETSDLNISSGGTGLTIAQMMNQAN